jgi:hypothetical protein
VVAQQALEPQPVVTHPVEMRLRSEHAWVRNRAGEPHRLADRRDREPEMKGVSERKYKLDHQRIRTSLESDHDLPAGDVDGDAGDPRGLLGGEEQRGGSDVVGLPDASEREGLRELLPLLGRRPGV